MDTQAMSAALAPVDHEGHQMIDARSLHGWLGSGDRFDQWLKRRCKEYGFIAGEDFYPHKVVWKDGRKVHHRQKDYLLTIDMAKELAMVERTEIGRETRRYFIKMERAAMQMASDHVANGTAEAIPQDFFDARARLEEMERRAEKMEREAEERFAALEARLPAQKPPMGEWLTARAVADYQGILDPRIPTPAQAAVSRQIGMELTGFCLLNGHAVKKSTGKFEERNLYPKAAVEAWLAQQAH